MDYHDNKFKELYNIIKDDLKIPFSLFKKNIWIPLQSYENIYYNEILDIYVDILLDCDVFKRILDDEIVEDDGIMLTNEDIIYFFIYDVNKERYNEQCKIYYRKNKLKQLMKCMDMKIS